MITVQIVFCGASRRTGLDQETLSFDSKLAVAALFDTF